MNDSVISAALDGNKLIIKTSEGAVVHDAKFLVAAMLVFVAKGSGAIEAEESSKMIDLLEQHFRLKGPEALELLTRVISELAERPELGTSLAELAKTLPDIEKEEIALMALKVIAADGHREVSEMERFNVAVEAAGFSPETVHRAFDRYFAETMPGDS